MNARSILKQLLLVLFISILGFIIWEYRSLFNISNNDNTQKESYERPPTPVDAQKVRIGNINTTIEAIGSMIALESINVSSEVPGIVEIVNFKEGSYVKKGQLLIKLESSEQEAEVQKWSAILENRKRLYEIGVKLEKKKNIAPTKVDELATNFSEAEAELKIATSKLNKRKIFAPFRGIVGITQISKGSYLRPGDLIVTLDAINPIELEFEIPETSISYLKNGSIIKGKTRAYENIEFNGKITTIDTRINTDSRSITIRALFSNPKLLLKPGMFMLVNFPLKEKENAIIIPEESILSNGNIRSVFSILDGKAKSIQVKLGERLPGEVEIVDGLKGDEILIVGGVQKVRNGQKVSHRNKE